MSSQSNIAPGPVAPENNPPIESQYFKPRTYSIANITLGLSTTVTTSTAHDYVVGQLVRLLVPQFYMTTELNNYQGWITSIPSSTEFVLDVQSTNFTSFKTDPSYAPTAAQVVAVGDVNTGSINSTGRTNLGLSPQGSFINISPN